MSGERKVGVTTYATPTDTEVVITRVVDAPRRLVFDAWTNPKYVPRWLLGPEGWTMPVCEIDLRPGGSWHYVWRKADGSEMTMRGSYQEVTPPERLVSTESWGPEWPETLNTLVLTESGGRTTITLTVVYPSKAARDAALQTGMKEGMDQGFARLDSVLKTFREDT
jgi:uncharacterized protein YndB with AHSA1/START domain